MRAGSFFAASIAVAVTVSVSVTANAQILTDEPVAPRPAPAQPPPAQPPPAQPPPAQPPPIPPPSQPAAAIPPPAQPGTPTQPPAPPPQTSGPATAQATGTAGAAAPVVGPAAAPEDTTIDHDKFVGHIGVGYMGIAQLPIGGSGNSATINAPVIGARYWLKRGLGVDAGIGFAFSGGSTEQAGQSVDKPGQLGVAFHGGVPLNFAYGKHYVFQLVPEATIGFTNATIKGTPDVTLSGFRLDLGARAGAEIHFGFIGVPELAIQASIGVYIHRESRSATPSGGSGQSSGDSTTTFATSVQGDPWALFANNLSALYYF